MASIDAVKRALQRENSTKQLTEGAPRGLGMADLKDFTELNNGALIIFSNDVYYNCSRGGKKGAIVNTILISDITNEAASKTKGLVLKEQLEKLLASKADNIIVDFNGISRFASPFFNYSFAALTLVYGFDAIRAIQIKNLSQVGSETYRTSMENAEMVSQHPEHIAEINQIIDNTPKKVIL